MNTGIDSNKTFGTVSSPMNNSVNSSIIKYQLMLSQ